MKKYLIIIGIVAFVGVAYSSGIAFAQASNPFTDGLVTFSSSGSMIVVQNNNPIYAYGAFAMCVNSWGQYCQEVQPQGGTASFPWSDCTSNPCSILTWGDTQTDYAADYNNEIVFNNSPSFVPPTPIQAPTIVLTTTATLTGSSSAGYTATVTVANSGTASAPNVQIAAATLGSATGSPLPANLETIPAGSSVTTTMRFLGTAGNDGAGVAEKYSGTYTGGSFGASVRSATLP